MAFCLCNPYFFFLEIVDRNSGAKFGAWAAGHSWTELVLLLLFNEFGVLQSDGRARKLMKWFAEYLGLAIFLCQKAPSVVQSQLVELGKLEPTPGSLFCKAHVQQKILVVCHWLPSSRGASGRYWIIAWAVLLWDWKYLVIGIGIKGLKSGKATNTDLILQNTVTEWTSWGFLWSSLVWRR